MTAPSAKPRVIKDFDKLDVAIQEQIKLAFPVGFEDHLVKFTNKEGKKVSALPYEAEDKYYLVRMTIEEAQQIIEDDDDYDDDGNLKADIQEEYEDKYGDNEDMDDEDMDDEDIDE